MSRRARDRDEIALSKTTLRIYLYLLETQKPCGPREIARSLGLAPSLVYYHLRKLEEIGIIKKTSEGYMVDKVIPIEGFVALGRRLIPRMFLYTALFLGLLTGEAIATAITLSLSIDRALLIAVTALGAIITALEGLSIKRRLRL